MHRWLKVGVLGLLAILALACGGIADLESANLMGTTSCTSICGKPMACDAAKGELKEGETAVVPYILGFRYEAGNTSQVDRYDAYLSQLNITITLSVDEGKAKASFKAPDGTITSVEASKDNPGVVSGIAEVLKEKLDPNTEGESRPIEKGRIEITVESLNGPASGVQVDFDINDCFDSYCKKTAPQCVK